MFYNSASFVLNSQGEGYNYLLSGVCTIMIVGNLANDISVFDDSGHDDDADCGGVLLLHVVAVADEANEYQNLIVGNLPDCAAAEAGFSSQTMLLPLLLWLLIILFVLLGGLGNRRRSQGCFNASLGVKRFSGSHSKQPRIKFKNNASLQPSIALDRLFEQGGPRCLPRLDCPPINTTMPSAMINIKQFKCYAHVIPKCEVVVHMYNIHGIVFVLTSVALQNVVAVDIERFKFIFGEPIDDAMVAVGSRARELCMWGSYHSNNGPCKNTSKSKLDNKTVAISRLYSVSQILRHGGLM
uniref:Uncharacterized protein n=1 Tax=Glossina austeni TaxID=7395 RepID=A0A1A9UMB9_GLOAU